MRLTVLFLANNQSNVCRVKTEPKIILFLSFFLIVRAFGFCGIDILSFEFSVFCIIKYTSKSISGSDKKKVQKRYIIKKVTS